MKTDQKERCPVQTPVGKRLYTIGETAGYLNCAVWAVRTLVWNGDLPFMKIGRRILIDHRDIDAFIERSKEKHI